MIYAIREVGRDSDGVIIHHVLQEDHLLASNIPMGIVEMILAARVLPRDTVQWKTSVGEKNYSGLDFLMNVRKNYLFDIGVI